MIEGIRTVELLAPARDLTCGIEAVNHGADAVYTGAPKFGARGAATNSVEDIGKLCDYAHIFGVRIYVALNTLIMDSELREAERLIGRLYDVGVDALIIQDMGLARLDIPPIALHASTQMDNRSVEKVRFLEKEGFSQVILARELSLDNIREIASGVSSIRLEAFIHGALCVSYSGKCYISQALCGRSANRGECAQYCRLPYTWTDSDGKVIASEKHLLSLRDLNRSDEFESMLDAGISSFKIEGRLKDVSYVKNITAWYRRRLDGIIARREGEFCRSSAGNIALGFEPVPEKSFNRGFTSYLLNGRTAEITSFDTPKSIGEAVGTVAEVRDRSFSIISTKRLNNGDGLVYFNDGLQGFRVNRVDDRGRIYPHEMPQLVEGMALYRNCDHEFEKLLSKPSSVRRIGIGMYFGESAEGFSLRVVDETGEEAESKAHFPEKKKANTPQEGNIRQQLSKLGNTHFEAKEITIEMKEEWFVPSSILSTMRREAICLLEEKRIAQHRQTTARRVKPVSPTGIKESHIGWQWNVSNREAETFYRERGAENIEPAFELFHRKKVPLMYTKHCLRYSMEWCPVHHKQPSPYKEPYFLTNKNIKLRLDFDCGNCQMLIFAE